MHIIYTDVYWKYNKEGCDATIKTGLKVYAGVNYKTYEIKRQVDESYEKILACQVIFLKTLPK